MGRQYQSFEGHRPAKEPGVINYVEGVCVKEPGSGLEYYLSLIYSFLKLSSKGEKHTLKVTVEAVLLKW